MKRGWWPRPLLSITLIVLWLAMVGSIAPAQWLLALVFAWALPQLLHKFLLPVPRVQKPLLLLRFIALVLRDIVVANVQVAILILQPNHRLRPAFVEMPLTLRDEFVIAVLMGVITLTPGTLSAQLNDERSSLLIHALHTDDTAALIAQLQQRYEQPLREIFGC